MAEPTQIGPYLIIGKIASGGMGTVYHARHTQMQRDVAIKVLHPSFAGDTDFVLRFQREVQATAALRHPNIIEVYDANNADGYHYLAMEYLENGSLQNVLARLKENQQKMSVDVALKAVRQIAMALDYAHSKGFVHRDIKPSNILAGSDERYILTDFGIVQQEGATKLTKTVVAIGTPEYMSPEQAQGQKVDGRSDIYSLGVVLYEMIGGIPPFTGDTSWAVIFRHIKEPPPPITKLRPDLAPAVRSVIDKMLLKSPGDRFQTAAELASAIDGALKRRSSGKKSIAPLAIGVTGVVTLAAIGTIVISALQSLPSATPPPALELPTTTKAPIKALVGSPTIAIIESKVAPGTEPVQQPTFTTEPTIEVATVTPILPAETEVATTAAASLTATPLATSTPMVATDTPVAKPIKNTEPAVATKPAPSQTPGPTSVPATPGMLYAAPALAAPQSGSSFQMPSIPRLTWTSVGALGPDDFYFVEVDHAKGVDPTYTKNTAMDAKDYLLGLQRSGPFTWRVSVVRKVGSGYTPVSPTSGNWSFSWTQSQSTGGGGGGGQPRNTPIPP